MEQDTVERLRQQRKTLEAQIRGYHFSFPILEASRLNIRTCLPTEHVLSFWNGSREVLNGQTRTLMALVSEYYQVQKKLDKLDHVQPNVD